VTDFRAALLCLINEARASQKLPPLERSAQLERVAQAQSNTFARTGSGSHGSSLSDIAARFIRGGDRHSGARVQAARRQRQPSGNARPSETRPHKVPTPIVSGMPVVGTVAPSANGSTVSLGLRCTGRLSCVLTSTLTLPDAHASADSGSVTIPAGAARTITYTYTQSAVTAERAAPDPNVSLSIDVTAPVPYAGTISGPLT
jgi:cysteine-rich secretory family protein